MSYVVYNIETTYILKGRNGKETYLSEAAAYAALTRAKKAPGFKVREYAIAESSYFHEKIEKQVERTNMMTGKKFKQPINTPRCCDPSTELYWCM